MPGQSLAILQSASGGGTAFSLSQPYRSGAYVSGAWKLAQNFAAELLTQRGSVRFDPSYGSRFPNEWRGHNVLSVEELRGILTRGINDVVTNMLGRVRMNDTLDETIASADIVRLQPYLDRVVAAIRITTEARQAVVVELPIELVDHNS
jgi:hypothetical protein